MCHPDGDPLAAESLSRLSSEYELAPSDVLIDARLVEHWQSPEVELREELGRRHEWTEDRAARFVADLRKALTEWP
jgi:hypothetical protein